MLNQYFNQGIHTERQQVQDLIEEAIQIYGIDCYYIPRTAGKVDKILGEDTRSVFSTALPIEMFMEISTNKGPTGAGDIFSKFGLEVRDFQEFSVSWQRWERAIAAYHPELKRPKEGDLIYFDWGNALNHNNELHEIKFVEHESPANQLMQVSIYKLKTEQFRFSNEVFQTGIDAVDEYAGILGVDRILFRFQTEDGSLIFKETEAGYMSLDTPPEINPSIRKFGDNEELQRQALGFTEFSTTNPFGEI